MSQITLTPRQLAVGGGCFAVALFAGIFLVVSGNQDRDIQQEPVQTFTPPAASVASPGAAAQKQETPAPAKRPAGKVYPKEIAYGEEVDIKDYAVPDKMMIFDFTSQYCPPCRRVAPRLEKLHFDREDVVVVKVNINRPGVRGIDFRSPVALKYRLPYVPYFVVLPADRSRVIEGKDAANMVYEMLQKNERG
ncbi:thiol-disulfide isomerase/thioredoxin [Ereboglobus sp. PH5-10]|nr:thiol-disulfide isomerase/thioredoxin [Ereboglobus sp. PH5-10]